MLWYAMILDLNHSWVKMKPAGHLNSWCLRLMFWNLKQLKLSPHFDPGAKHQEWPQMFKTSLVFQQLIFIQRKQNPLHKNSGIVCPHLVQVETIDRKLDPWENKLSAVCDGWRFGWSLQIWKQVICAWWRWMVGYSVCIELPKPSYWRLSFSDIVLFTEFICNQWQHIIKKLSRIQTRWNSAFHANMAYHGVLWCVVNTSM